MFLLPAKSEGRAPQDDFWYGPLGPQSSAGQRVTPDRALQLGAVYACVRVLAETVAQLPLILYQKDGDRTRRRATEHQLYRVLHHQANPLQTSFEWREMMQGHLALRGNAYSEKEYRGNELVALWPLHPDHVEPKAVMEGPRGPYMAYRITNENGQSRDVLSDDILHLRGLQTDGFVGLNPIEIEREALGMSLAAEDFAARFLKNDTQVSNWIEHPGNFRNEEEAKKFREAYQRAQSGANRFKTPVLPHGMKLHNVSINAKDAQFLETRKYQSEDIARIFRVPPHKIGILDRATFSNIEHQAVEFVTDTMIPWLKRWEQRLADSLIPLEQREEFYFEFLVDGLLRGDSEARANYYSRGILDGWMARNEARVRENMDPKPGLDEFLTPLNMAEGERSQEQARRNANTVAEKEMRFVRAQIASDDVEKASAKLRDFYRDELPRFAASLMVADDDIEALRGYYASRLETLADAIIGDDTQALLANWAESAAFDLMKVTKWKN